MKSEFLYRKDFKNMEHFEQELAKYISYYNHKRIKAKLKGMSPIQYGPTPKMLPNEITVSNFWGHFK